MVKLALDAPLPVVEIHQNLVPYRTHRAVLGLESSQDYEMTVLRLLAGERGYAHVEPDEVRHLLEREVRAVNPETGVFRRFPSASVRLDPDQVRVILGVSRGAAAPEPQPPVPPEPEAPEPIAPAVTAFQLAEGEAPPEGEEATDQAELPFVLDDGVEEPPVPTGRDVTIGGAQCGYCGGDLPVGRTVIFCPHCGQNVGVVHCPSCGADMNDGPCPCRIATTDSRLAVLRDFRSKMKM
jgi:hypothetical protein